LVKGFLGPSDGLKHGDSQKIIRDGSKLQSGMPRGVPEEYHEKKELKM
jgi:hypothetical protein